MKAQSARAIFLSALFLSALPSTAWGVRYNQPKYRGYHLDWCRIFEHECGKPAADAFCRLNGHLQATNWSFWSNPGFQTMTIGQNSICDPGSHVCDTFGFIDCQAASQVFNNPTYRGYRLDWCRIFENECGAPAADAFCRYKGFARQTGFQFQRHPGVQTMTIGQNSICDPNNHVCDSFTYIRCAN